MLRPLFYIAAFACFFGAALTAHATDGPITVEAAAIPLNADDPAQLTVGGLRYLGGLHLTSGSQRFGGISGLRWLGEDRKFLAITDAGDWLRLDLAEDEKGRLTGIAAAEIGLLTDERGAPMIAKELADAEALNIRRVAVDGGAERRASVWFERSHRRQTYRLTEDGRVGAMLSEAPFAPDPPLPNNGGIEAATSIEAGLLLFAEGARNETGETRAFLRARCFPGGPGSEPRICTRTLAAPVPAPYRPTDAVSLRGNRLLLLSRHFSPADGVSVRLDRLTFDPAARTFARAEVAVLAPPLSVDNFEGISLRREGDRIFLYLVSDDNFNALQRTLLLKFELTMPAPALAPN
ncbi:MAG: esterase-like activity of phytase family protein [Pacificimonas sp.]|jgi:hypothetical protein|nr:esterase-like activity of phytase family protein [Pacificimonas sp.]